MKKKSLLLCFGMIVMLLSACGEKNAEEIPSTAIAEEVSSTEAANEVAEAVTEETTETELEEQAEIDYTENATQVLLEQKTAYSDIGEFYQVELYYPNDANLEIKSSNPNVVTFTCEDEDYVVEIRTLEDSTFLNNWEADKAEETYTELEWNGFKGYYTDKVSGYADKVEMNLQLDPVTSDTSRYLKIKIGESYAGDHASGMDLYQNNETVKHILGSIQYIGNIEKTSMQDGLLVLEGKKYDMLLEDPSAYLATDNENMTWECQVKDSYIYIKAKDSTDESVFFTTSIKRDNNQELEAWKENILKYSPDNVIENQTIGSYEMMTYALEETESEIDCTHAVVKDGALLNFKSYATNRAMVEEYIAAMLDHMEIQFK